MARTVARGALWSFSINVAGTAIAFAVQVLLARGINAEGYGMYLYALAWVHVALLPGKLEFDACTVRFVGAYVATREWSLLRGFLRRSHELVAGASVISAAAMITVAWLARDRLSVGLLPALAMASLLLPVHALLQMQIGCLQGFKRVIAAQVPNVIGRPLMFGLGVALVAYLSGVPLGAPGAIGMQLAATAVTLVISSRALRHATPLEARSAVPAFRTGYWLHAVVGLLLISGSNLILSTQMDVLVVGTLLGAHDAGVYGAASQLTSLIGFGATAIAFIVTPMLADLHARGNTRDLQRLVTFGVRANLAVSLPTLPLLMLFGKLFLGWFGPAFVAGYTVLIILAVGRVIVTPIMALAGYVMTMTGRQYQAGFISAVTAALNIGLAIALTPRFGALGTAMATSIAAIVRTVASAIYIKRALNISLLALRQEG
jgi:O-antigen/teichoic acid export membrane protein